MTDKKFSVKVLTQEPLTAREKLKLTQLDDVTPISSLTKDGASFVITLSKVYFMEVHNEYAKNPDYTLVVYEDTEGNRFSSSSEFLYQSVLEIQDAMADSDEEYEIEISEHPSRNNAQGFLKATIV
ncbi:MAG: single-stranded DNA-binding protein [Podoviridae sp. ctjc_2]|nr:MAG: single-stranded DNA-binding protein [Podoviridae sp. ctjc_2]